MNLTQKIFEANAEYENIQEKLHDKLDKAALKEIYEDIQEVLEAGADPNYKINKSNNKLISIIASPIYPALITGNVCGNLPIVKLFIWYGATTNNINKVIKITHVNKRVHKDVIRFIKYYAPKIERIKRENMIKKINNFLKQQVVSSIDLPKVITNLVLEYTNFYPENLSELAKISNQEIDEIISIYDKNINIKASASECLVM